MNDRPIYKTVISIYIFTFGFHASAKKKQAKNTEATSKIKLVCHPEYSITNPITALAGTVLKKISSHI